MDPNANLAEQEELLQEMSEYEADHTRHHPAYLNAQNDLGELRQALYDWIRDGGFEPDWAKAPRASRHYGH